MRDKVAVKVCNFMLNRVATKSYRDRIGSAIAIGLIAMYDTDSELHTAALREADKNV